MSESLPYLVSPGALTKALEKIKDAATPERVTQDFLKTKLNVHSPGSVLPYLKRIGFVNTDGAPSNLYLQFRNSAKSGIAAAKAARIGYKKLYELNEYAHELEDSELKGLIVQITGFKPDSSVVRLILSTFKKLREFCDFDKEQKGEEIETSTPFPMPLSMQTQLPPSIPHKKGLGVNLSYTINLNLPATTNIEVFNAIFKSLRDNLLKDE